MAGVEEICQWLSDVAVRCAGPFGDAAVVPAAIVQPSATSAEVLRQMVEWMTADRDALSDESVSGRAARRLSFARHPLTQLVVQQVRSQGAALGDGGWLLVHICTAISLHSLRKRPPPSAAELGLRVCREWTRDFWAGPGQKLTAAVKMSSARDLVSVVSSHLTSNGALRFIMQRCELEADSAAGTVVKAFVSAIRESEGRVDLGCVRFVHLPYDGGRAAGRGAPVCVEAVGGVVIDWPVPIEWTIAKRNGLGSGATTVALFDICLEPAVALPEGNGLSATIRGQSDVDAATADLRELAAVLRTRRVGLLLCQKTIHPSLRLELARSGIASVERLSLRHVAAVRHATGAVPISTLDASSLSEGALGECGGVAEWMSGNKRHMLLLGRADSPVSTLVLRGSAALLDEAERAMRSALTILAALLKPGEASVVVAGGAASESALAAYLRLRWDLAVLDGAPGLLSRLDPSLQELVHVVVSGYVHALEAWAGIVSGTARRGDVGAAASPHGLRSTVHADLVAANAEACDFLQDLEDALRLPPLLCQRFRLRSELADSAAASDPLPRLEPRDSALAAVHRTLQRGQPVEDLEDRRTAGLRHRRRRLAACDPPPSARFAHGKTFVGSCPTTAAAPSDQVPTAPRTVWGSRSGELAPVLAIRDGSVAASERLPLVDLLAPKRQALLSALDVAGMMLRTDGAVVDVS